MVTQSKACCVYVTAVFSQPTGFLSVKEGAAYVRDDSNSDPTSRIQSQHAPPHYRALEVTGYKETTGGLLDNLEKPGTVCVLLYAQSI